ncbi:MAG: Crp/Fnr family transcriptional regulator [Thermodesulfovibrionales bacterium]
MGREDENAGLREGLRGIELFSELPDRDMEKVLSRVSVRRYKKGGVILHEEETNEFIYMVISGGAKVVRTSEDGKEMIIAMHPAGDFFGEITLIDGKTVPATVVAREDSVVGLISKGDFHALLFSEAAISQALLRIMCGRLRDSWEKIRLLTYRNAALRIRSLLLMLAGQYGEETPEGEVLNVKLTHQSIADMTNLTRETVTRMLDRLQKDGEIAMLKNRVIRLNPAFYQKDEAGFIRE